MTHDLPEEDGEATHTDDLSGLTWLCDRIAVTVAGIALLAMMLMTLVDVVGRYFLNAPLGFAFEMTQIGMAVVVFSALPSVTLHGRHVSAGLFEGLFKGRAALLRDLIWLAVIAASCLGLAWRLSTLAERFVRYGDRTSVLELPIGWVAWFGVAALGLSALAALVAGASRLREEYNK
ncbi:TRAP transporter small permease [Martelella mediterranea]|uniref:TRAP transporter small permease n=1 Tax=Martelella mediterranea TaxID=293089 RepID=UPI001E3F92BC|nr:TRAP transporter small permease [Martelella mediterranea]MCD1635003.1 TRAP transporter small permease [Martelella mediterranea]